MAHAHTEEQAVAHAVDLLERRVRNSIVAFLNVERVKHERAHAEHIATRRSVVARRQREYDDKMLRLDAYASILRTLIASIERGDDMGPR